MDSRKILVLIGTLCTIVVGQLYGPYTNVKMSTSCINTWCEYARSTYGATDVPAFATAGRDFFEAFQTAQAAKYPGSYATHVHDLHNEQLTWSNFKNSDFRYSHIYFHAGHGGTGSIPLYNGDVVLLRSGGVDGGAPADSFSFWGYTTWAFFHSCLTLGYGTTERHAAYNRYGYARIAKGIHAIGGFQSLSYSFSGKCISKFLWWCTKYDITNRTVYNNFMRHWITDDETVGKAWCDSWTEIISGRSNIPGLYVCVLSPQGYIKNQWGMWEQWAGGDEHYSSAIHCPTPYYGNCDQMEWFGYRISDLWKPGYWECPCSVHDMQMTEYGERYGTPSYGL